MTECMWLAGNEVNWEMKQKLAYRKIQIISRELIFLQNTFWSSYFLGGGGGGTFCAFQKFGGLFLEGILHHKSLRTL